jgi:hypothetical protein
MSTGMRTAGAFSRLTGPPSGCDADPIKEEVATWNNERTRKPAGS